MEGERGVGVRMPKGIETSSIERGYWRMRGYRKGVPCGTRVLESRDAPLPAQQRDAAKANIIKLQYVPENGRDALWRWHIGGQLF